MSTSAQTSAPEGPAPSTHGSVRRFEDLPGPRAWPLMGNAMQVQFDQIHVDFERWARMYGPLYRASW